VQIVLRTLVRRGARPHTPAPTQNRGGAGMAKRTTMRSSKGKKLYAVRDKKGRFKDIQTYKRAHSMDMKRKSKKES
jgi:hypothetical protein